MNNQGTLNAAMLHHLVMLARQAETKGGKLLLFMPPLLPGMEAAFLQHPQWSATLLRSKDVLRAWATLHNIIILDAGQSERFGCADAEFVDTHHAASSCYSKIFKTFFDSHTRNAGEEIVWPRGGIY